MDYLDTLNPPQREAVENTDGPMMVIAGAGSGKTRVLTFRIAHLVGNGVETFSILALTFTNKAAREMRERIQSLVGSEAKNLWMGTFHSIFAKILRIEGSVLGYNSNFTIYDSDDSKSVIKSILKDFQLDDKLYKPSGVLAKISSAKNNLISWRKYQSTPQLVAEDEEAGRPKIGEIYKEYAMRCFKANAMDFDDLLFNTNVLFANFPDILNKYQHKFKYVLIDEFQDTNLSQYGITRKIAAVHQNICVVGDDAQSIYAFRGANIQNILNFEKDYPELKTVKLEQNYRSTQNIVNAANSLIRNNQNQLPKKVWTDNDQGTKIQLVKTASDLEEGRWVATTIFEEKMKHNLTNSNFAILYRTNAQSRAIEEALRRLNIAYKIYGGLSFYQRKEIKDMIGYLRFTINSADMEAFKRIVNYPKRGIGSQTVSSLNVKANEANMPLWDVLTNIKQLMGSGRSAVALDTFATMIKDFKIVVKQKDAYEAASHIAKVSGVLHELYSDKTVEGKVRYDNLQELLNGIKAYVDDPDNEDKSLEGFLEQVALLTTADTPEEGETVSLMTIHMSKGLEYPYVFIVGMEENLFPSQLMLESRADLEEERRLFYVAITRAEKNLFLSYTLQRYKYGRLNMSESSRFLEELDPQYLDSNESMSNSAPPEFMSNGATGPAGNKPGFTKKLMQSPKPAAPSGHKPSANFKPSPASQLKPGVKVEHMKFGFGKVVSIDNNGANAKAKILFDTAGEKTMMLSFAKLMVCDN